MVKVIGLTGGVGSGKTFVAQYAGREFHIPVILADEIGHLCYRPKSAAYQEVIDAFGKDMAGADGEINRAALSAVVFKSPEKLEQLNRIVHPFIEKTIAEQIREIKKEGMVPCVLLEAAILLTSGLRSLCDEIWYVKADRSLRIRRLMESRGYDGRKIENIMAAQPSEEEFERRTDKIIINNGSKEDIRRQLEMLIKRSV